MKSATFETPPKNIVRRAAHTLLATVVGVAAVSATLHAENYYSAWLQEYDKTLNRSQAPAAIAMDKHGNVVVTGYAKDASNVSRYYTVKYDALDGHVLWEASEGEGSGSNIFEPQAIAVDSAGNVIVTGSRNTGGSIDFYTVKYDGLTGAAFWASPKTYNGTADGQDIGLKVAVDSNDQVFVTGRSAGSGSGDDIVTIKYDKTTGAQQGAADRFTTAGTRNDFPTGIAVDSSNRVVVVGTANTGSSVFRFYVRRLNNALSAFNEVTLTSPGTTGGATGVAVDSSNNIIVTGRTSDGSGHPGIYTLGLLASDMSTDWETFQPPTSTDFINNGIPFAPTVSVGPDNNPVVSGYLEDVSNNISIRTIKYQAGGFFGGAVVVWETTDSGLGNGDSFVHQVITDGSSNAIIIGETDNADNDLDIYVAKYDALTGDRVYGATFAGDFGTDDIGVGVAVDGNGGIATTGAAKKRVNNIGYNEFATIKFNRFLAYSGDDLPDDAGVPANAVYAAGYAPAVADNGAVAALIKIASGKSKLSAIFTQGSAGGTSLPAVQKGDAPGIDKGIFAKFSNPIVSPDGHYAFAAKVKGVPGSKSNGVWTNLGGTLHLALQQGTPVPGMTENLSKVLSLSMDNSAIVALVKVSGSGATNYALVRINAANSGTVIRRKGDPIMVGGVSTNIKSLTVLSPAKSSPGDGRWHQAGNVVIKATLADKRTAILFSSSIFSSDLVTGSGSLSPKSFGLPTLSASGSKFATVINQTLGGAVTKANDTVIVFPDPTGNFLFIAAAEGGHPLDPGLSSFTFSAFSDPLVDSIGGVSFLAQLKGQGVSGKNNKALFYGLAQKKVARTGDAAALTDGTTDTAAWSSIGPFALGGGRPVFVGKLKGKGVNGKNNTGVWGVDSRGVVRRFLRTGDVLGDLTVKKFVLLNVVPTAFSAARSFNNTGSITALVYFTNKKQALIKIGIP